MGISKGVPVHEELGADVHAARRVGRADPAATAAVDVDEREQVPTGARVVAIDREAQAGSPTGDRTGGGEMSANRAP